MAKKKAATKTAKKVGPTDLTAQAKAAWKECLKQERELGGCRKGYEFYGNSKAAKQVRKLMLRKELAPFWAKHFKVSQDRFEGWRDHEIAGEWNQCSAVTKSGRPCSRSANRAFFPSKFLKGWTDCCLQHKRELTEEDKILLTMGDIEGTRAEAIEFLKLPREQQMAILFQRSHDSLS